MVPLSMTLRDLWPGFQGPTSCTKKYRSFITYAIHKYQPSHIHIHYAQPCSIFRPFAQLMFLFQFFCILFVYYAPDDTVWRRSVWRLSDFCCVHPVGGRCILADRARPGQPGSRLPLHASVVGLGGGISWRPPTYSLFSILCIV